MMAVKYCPRGEIKKLEIELCNLKVKGTDVASYSLRFQELALMCGRMFHEESEEVEKYVGGLPDMIRGNVMSYQPKTIEKAIEFANDQMDQKVLSITERQSEQKRKCNKCKKTSHLARDCRSSGPNGNNNNHGNFGTTQNAVTCYECGVQGHFKKVCPKLKNGNRGNQRRNDNAPAKVYVVGNAGTNPNSNVITGVAAPWTLLPGALPPDPHDWEASPPNDNHNNVIQGWTNRFTLGKRNIILLRNTSYFHDRKEEAKDEDAIDDAFEVMLLRVETKEISKHWMPFLVTQLAPLPSLQVGSVLEFHIVNLWISVVMECLDNAFYVRTVATDLSCNRLETRAITDASSQITGIGEEMCTPKSCGDTSTKIKDMDQGICSSQ
ncbi:putative reverse transcriptase domain-containing protein [Tanacetum coccineum]